MVAPADSPEEAAVGDGRKKHVTVVHPSGEQTDHGDVYVKHSARAFLVSADADFPDDETTRYEKDEVLRAEISQHHAACFITTATAGDEPTLDALRTFRDGTMVRRPTGRALVWLYDRVSPPLARTLARHPETMTARLVRWLVRRCAAVARRHRTASGIRAAALGVLLTAVYLIGLLMAIFGVAVIRVRALTG